MGVCNARARELSVSMTEAVYMYEESVSIMIQGGRILRSQRKYSVRAIILLNNFFNEN